MKPALRDVLIRHIDGPVPIIRTGPYHAALQQCAAREWVRLGHSGGRGDGGRAGSHVGVRPRFSYITMKGRDALCRALAEWADSLVDKQLSRIDEESGTVLEPGVLELAE